MSNIYRLVSYESQQTKYSFLSRAKLVFQRPAMVGHVSFSPYRVTVEIAASPRAMFDTDADYEIVIRKRAPAIIDPSMA